MKIFGFEITLAKANPLPMQDAFRPIWWPIGSTINESYPGAWQQNVEVRFEDTLTYWAVFRCISIISSDIAKLRLKLVQRDDSGIWTEVTDNRVPFLEIIGKPNRYQTRIQFYRRWLESKLSRGNTYALKQRDGRGMVRALYVLDPSRVKPLVSDSGQVFYRLGKDNLAEIDEDSITVPADEIIHDRWNTLYHDLVGLSPLCAVGLNAVSGLNIQKNSVQFFGNNSQPGGILTAPGTIPDEHAARLKARWEANYSGKNAGKVAILGDGLKYEAMAVTAQDAQLIEQLKWSAETIAGAFGVPSYMLNIGGAPTYNNVEALVTQYYSQCLQVLIKEVQVCLREGLNLGAYAAHFDLEELLQMDTATKTDAAGKAIGAGFLKPNEARQRFNLPPVKGGDTPYLQQQNYSLAALAKRDALENPFGAKNPTPEAAPSAPAASEDDEDDDSSSDGERQAKIERVKKQILKYGRRLAA